MAINLLMLARQVFILAYGLVAFVGAFTVAALMTGALWSVDSKQEKEELAIAQKRFWSLDREPLPAFRHAFFTTSNGTKIHYIINGDADTATAKNVTIFVHGFPDSFVLWRYLLQSPELQRNNILIAVDLPGYGGSDSLPAYGPEEVLGALTEYIIGMRKQYLQDNKRVIVVSHDWGTVICARLASEAKGLADHYVLASAILPHVVRTNAINGVASAGKMLRTWVHQPLNLYLLNNAFNALFPVLSQLRRSFYVFCFNLPWPLHLFFSTFGNYWFLRVLHSLTKGSLRRGDKLIGRLQPKEAGESMATTTGPGTEQIGTTLSNSNGLAIKYGESVRKRIFDRGMSEKIRLYREDLFEKKWEKSLEVTAALFEITTANSKYFSVTRPDGYMNSPITLLLGQYDAAFNLQLSLNNIKEFLIPGSHVLTVKGAGHWLPIEPMGRDILVKTILWTLEAEQGGKRSDAPFAKMSNVLITAEK